MYQSIEKYMGNTLFESVEGEVSLVIHYEPNISEALLVLQSAMRLIEGLDALDHALLSSIDTSLEPVSILNDVQHSSIKLILARALRTIPDEAIHNLEWKIWLGSLLVKGKHLLLSHLDGDPRTIQATLNELKQDYLNAPNSTTGYLPPSIENTTKALHKIKMARATLPNSEVSFETELGIIDLPYTDVEYTTETFTSQEVYSSTGRGLFMVKSPDMLGNAQWKVLFNKKSELVKITHEAWLNEYHARHINIAPHDSLDADYQQDITYDENQVEIEKTITLTYIHRVVLPPENMKLFN